MIVIDRFEGEYAILEYEGNTFNFPKNLLPSEAKEGDILKIIATINQEMTSNRKENLQERLNNLFKNK